MCALGTEPGISVRTQAHLATEPSLQPWDTVHLTSVDLNQIVSQVRLQTGVRKLSYNPPERRASTPIFHIEQSGSE